MSIALVRDLTAELLVVGQNLNVDVAKRATKWKLDMGVDRTTQLSVTLEDPGLGVLRGRILQKGASVRWRDLDLTIAALRVGAGEAIEAVRFDARTTGVEKLKRTTGPKVWRDIAAHELIQQEANAVGLSYLGETNTMRRAQIMRAAPTGGSTPRYEVSADLLSVKTISGPAGEASDESTWDVFGRLAGEEGKLLFEMAGVVVFARPSWLVDQAAQSSTGLRRWRWPQARPLFENEDALLDVPDCDDSDDAPTKRISGTLHVDDAISYRPGHAVPFEGIPGFEDTYLVAGVAVDVGEVEATVTLVTPVDPEARAPGGSDNSGSGGGAISFPVGTSSALVERFVAAALAQAGDRYVWGAGRTGDPDPEAFDCSGLVYWSARQAGVPSVGGTAYGQWADCRATGRLIAVASAITTRGALLFMGDGSGVGRDAITHVAISLGDGNTIEARGTRYGVGVFGATRGFDYGGLLVGLNYGATAQVL